MTATDATQTRYGRQRPSETPTRGRGVPKTITMRRTTFAAALIEGMSLADEVERSAERIQTFAACGSRELIAHEAGRIGVRCTAARAELRAMAEGLES